MYFVEIPRENCSEPEGSSQKTKKAKQNKNNQPTPPPPYNWDTNPGFINNIYPASRDLPEYCIYLS